MRVSSSMNCKPFFTAALLFVIAALPHSSHAQQNWNATVGGQSKDMASQAVAFLPNEMWIHAGDNITWTFASGDIHSVTFLTVGQVYPFDFTQGCPPITPSGMPFDGSSCVSSAPLTSGQTYQVIFPKAGNYEIVCLVHAQMFGTIHVLDPTLPLPYDQAAYDQLAKEQLKALLEDADLHKHHAEHQHSLADRFSVGVNTHTKSVTAGVGEIAATAGGQQSFSLVRFMNGTVTIHAGDTVEWTNLDPEIGHTINLWYGSAGHFRSILQSQLRSEDRSGWRAARHDHQPAAKRTLRADRSSTRRRARHPAGTGRATDTVPHHVHETGNLPVCLCISRQPGHGWASHCLALTECLRSEGMI